MITIYLRTNTVNGMQYVGQTNNIKKRNWDWNCLKWNYANPLINRDREKYGLDKWESKVLKECDDSEGDYWEEYYIKELNTKFPNGYNFRDGGNGKGYIPTEETRKKISEAHKGKYVGEKCWNYGIKRSEEFKQKVSEALKGRKVWNKGVPMREESKKKLSEARTGKPTNKKSRTIYQYTKDKELVKVWTSIKELKKEYSQGNVYECCNGRRKTHKGYLWSYEKL